MRESWGGEDAADSIAQLSSWQLSTFEMLWVPIHLGFFFVFTVTPLLCPSLERQSPVANLLHLAIVSAASACAVLP